MRVGRESRGLSNIRKYIKLRLKLGRKRPKTMFFSYFMHRENSATENRLSDRANFRICCSPNRPLLTLKISAIYLFYFFYYYNWRKSSHKIGAKIVRKWIFSKLCWIWLKFCTHVGLAVRLTDPVEFCEKSEI